jgi:hypothetical protein
MTMMILIPFRVISRLSRFSPSHASGLIAEDSIQGAQGRPIDPESIIIT